jgi:hypothetical protein
MWLISTSALELRFVADPIIEDYAILSHTWGDEEVTFRAMNATDRLDRTKKGWKRLPKHAALPAANTTSSTHGLIHAAAKNVHPDPKPYERGVRE